MTPGDDLTTAGGSRPLILVGAHHKTGSVWMANIFSAMAKILQMKMHVGSQSHLPADADLFLHDHSAFDLQALTRDYRGLHLIRDPRDVVISACFYHRTANESWLHEKRAEFGGLSYQEKINAYASLDDQLFFEMENCSRFTIAEMDVWDYANPRFIEMTYETLIADTTLVHFRRIFRFLRFSEGLMPALLQLAYRQSLFSATPLSSPHVRSGEPAQWRQYFKPAHRRYFGAQFGSTLIHLGYECDDGWIEGGGNR